MKQFLTRTFCLFMALQVLLSSTGFATTEHWCALKGKKTFLFVKPKKCCQVAQNQATYSLKPAVKRSKCCSEQVVFHKINANAAQGSEIDFKIPAPVWAVFSVPVFGAYSVITHSVSLRVLHYFNTVPPLAGRQRLLFLQTFLI